MRASTPRIVAVLGYSDGRGDGSLHRICAARVRRAAEVASPTDVVVFSGWARRGSNLSEAELMHRAWPAGATEVFFNSAARTTAENAFEVARIARDLDAEEVVVVTSSWHAPRARLLFRAALRGSGARLDVAAADGGRPLRPVLGEIWRWPLVPLQVALARRPARQAPGARRRISGR